MHDGNWNMPGAGLKPSAASVATTPLHFCLCPDAHAARWQAVLQYHALRQPRHVDMRAATVKQASHMRKSCMCHRNAYAQGRHSLKASRYVRRGMRLRPARWSAMLQGSSKRAHRRLLASHRRNGARHLRIDAQAQLWAVLRWFARGGKCERLMEPFELFFVLVTRGDSMKRPHVHCKAYCRLPPRSAARDRANRFTGFGQQRLRAPGAVLCSTWLWPLRS